MGMKYEPIKDFLTKVFRAPFARRLFYKAIDILLLRTWHIHKYIKLWLKQAPPEPDVLDAGSGLGQHSYFIARHCPKCKIIGIDINQRQVDDANYFFQRIGYGDRVKFQTGNLEQYVCPQCFDLVLNIEVIEHILNDKQVLDNFSRSLRKGGWLILSTPSLYAESHDHEHDEHDSDHDKDKDYFVDEHVREGYDPEELKQMLENVGFTDVNVKFMYGKWGGKAWVLSMKWPIIMLNKSFLFFLILPVYYLILSPVILLFDWLDTVTENKRGGSLLVIAKK